MKKFLVDAYLAKNLGDDLFLKILFDRYRDAEVEWHLYTDDKTYSKTFGDYTNVIVHYNNIVFKLLNKINTTYKLRSFLLANKYDGFLKIGGSIFIQAKKWKKQLNRNKYIIKSFKDKNKKVFIIGANFGPYTEENYQKTYRKIFKKCDDVCFRDEYSFNLFNDIDTVRLAPDIIFTLNYTQKSKMKKTVGISVINLKDRHDLARYEDEYTNKNRELIEGFIEEGYNIYLYSFCEKQGDKEAILKILNSLQKEILNRVKIIEYKGDINEFLDTFSSMESIIGCRFHSIILSMVFNQGFYPIVYSNKTNNVLQDLNLGQYMTSIKDISQLNIKEVMNIISNNHLVERNVIDVSRKQFEKLDQFIF